VYRCLLAEDDVRTGIGGQADPVAVLRNDAATLAHRGGDRPGEFAVEVHLDLMGVVVCLGDLGASDGD